MSALTVKLLPAGFRGGTVAVVTEDRMLTAAVVVVIVEERRTSDEGSEVIASP